MEKMELGEPSHPLITIIDVSKVHHREEFLGIRFSNDMYCIALKDASCGLDYGRNQYDFTNGVLAFTGPQQVVTVTQAPEIHDNKGWLLYFHPDLIRNQPLGEKIDEYTFFDYAVHEALHLSEAEQNTLTQVVQLIQSELNERIDDHSQKVLVSNIELLLNHCSRYYQRQFNTRSAQNSDVVSKVEKLLKDYYKNDGLVENGQPSIQYLADHCHLSTGYLSDLLVKETGRTAKDHINDFLIEKAKNLLIQSDDTISGIAYTLGFNYPHYFGRLFKQKTGLTPQEYRTG